MILHMMVIQKKINERECDVEELQRIIALYEDLIERIECATKEHKVLRDQYIEVKGRYEAFFYGREER